MRDFRPALYSWISEGIDFNNFRISMSPRILLLRSSSIQFTVWENSFEKFQYDHHGQLYWISKYTDFSNSELRCCYYRSRKQFVRKASILFFVSFTSYHYTSCITMAQERIFSIFQIKKLLMKIKIGLYYVGIQNGF